MPLCFFRFDFEKICHNTCNYECEDSDLFKFSQRLLMDGQKHFSEDQIRQLLPQAPYMKLISKAELGFELSNKGTEFGRDCYFWVEARFATIGSCLCCSY